MASENSKTIAGESISVISAHKNNTTCNAHGGKRTQWEVTGVFNQRSKHIQRRKLQMAAVSLKIFFLLRREKERESF